MERRATTDPLYIVMFVSLRDFGFHECDDDVFIFFFFNDTATTEIYTLSLHDALPISPIRTAARLDGPDRSAAPTATGTTRTRSEEHTSELQSRQYLVCRLLLEKKKNIHPTERTTLRLTTCSTAACPRAGAHGLRHQAD